MQSPVQDLRGEGPSGEDPECLPLGRAPGLHRPRVPRPRAPGPGAGHGQLRGGRREGLGPGRAGIDPHGVRAHRLRSSTTWPGSWLRHFRRCTGEEATATTTSRQQPRGGDRPGRGPARVRTRWRRSGARPRDLREQLLRKRAEFENYRSRSERDRDQARLREGRPGPEGAHPAHRQPGARAGGGHGGRPAATGRRADPARADVAPGGERRDDRGSGGPAVRPRAPPGALPPRRSPGFPDGTIVEVFRKGYALKERLLRPALVKVAQADGDGEDTSRDEKVH